MFERQEIFINKDKSYRDNVKYISQILSPWRGQYIFIKGISVIYYCHKMMLGKRISYDYYILVNPEVAEEIFDYLLAKRWTENEQPNRRI